VDEVRAVAPDGRGGWFLGGDFTSVCGQSRRDIAQVDAAGNLTAWNPNPDGAVNSLLVTGGRRLLREEQSARR